MKKTKEELEKELEELIHIKEVRYKNGMRTNETEQLIMKKVAEIKASTISKTLK